MPDIILHHYPESTFSEKPRIILGLKKLAWKSVITPMIMPKPDLTALTGGYRRAPVMQIGSDVYCDTALIAKVLDGLVPENGLFPDGQRGLAESLAQWADNTLFMAAVGYFYLAPAAENRIAQMPPAQAQAYQADRAALLSHVHFPGFEEMAATVAQYLDRLEDMLAGGQAFLLGERVTIADVSCYHPLWFLCAMPSSTALIGQRSRVVAWMKRVGEFGHGQMTEISSDAALTIARNTPAATIAQGVIDLAGINFGDQVTVMPTDYGRDPVQGALVALHANEVAVRREDPRAGTVTVHFPRVGYQIKKA